MRMTLVSMAGALALASAAPVLAETKSFQFQDAKIVYDDAGPETDSGRTPIVFVHGWASSRTFWHSQIDAFQKDRRVLAIDLPGNGDSDDVADEHSMDLYAEVIAAAMDDAGIEEAVLIGHSNGVPTIRQFYRRHPDRVAAFVGVDGSFQNLMPPDMMETFLNMFRGEDYADVAEQFLTQLAALMKHPEDVELVRKVVLATPQRVMVGALEAAADPAIWIDDRIDAPLLIINAQNPFWTQEYNARLNSLSDDVELHTWEGVSHFLFMDEPERFNETLGAFLDERDC